MSRVTINCLTQFTKTKLDFFSILNARLSTPPFWAAAPKGRCSVECRGYFVRPYVRPYVRTSVHPYVRTPLAQAPWPRPPGPGPPAQAQAPWPRPLGPGPPAQAQAPRPRPPSLGLTGPNLVKAGRTDGRTDKISPAFYRTSPLWGRCPAHNLITSKTSGPQTIYGQW